VCERKKAYDIFLNFGFLKLLPMHELHIPLTQHPIEETGTKHNQAYDSLISLTLQLELSVQQQLRQM
jgi:hypothetical protein